MMKSYVTEINGLWYAFAGDAERNQVHSIGKDVVHGGNATGWFAGWSERGIKYVASSVKTKRAAVARAKKWASECACGIYDEEELYGGEV